jgi:asparagine N-glycosylation enzyme membrane subunit Stt3
MGFPMADDDIKLDIGKFFRKKAPEQPADAHETHGSHPEHPHEHHAPKAESLSLAPGDTGIDVKKTVGWFKTHSTLLLMLLLILIPMFLSFNIRVQPESMPLANDWATNNVMTFIHDDITRVYQAQYPNLPTANRQRLIDQDYAKSVAQASYTVRSGDYRGQTFTIADQIARDAAQFRSFFQYEANGVSYTYMPDIDPYTWLRYARNYLATGDIADERRNGLAYDNHMVAPLGAGIDTTFHPYTIAWLYEIMHVFNGKITLMEAAGYHPLIFMVLAIIPVFFIGRRVGGLSAGFFASIIFSVNGALLGRTLWGHADTDTYNVFFPLMIVWCFLEAYYTEKLWKRVSLLGVAGLATGLFAFSWSGWWYIFDFVLAVGGIYFVYLLWVHRKEWAKLTIIRNKDVIRHVLNVVGYIVLSGIFVTAFLNFSTFIQAPLDPLDFVSIKNAAKITLFPNVLTTVAELNAASLGDVLRQMGTTAVGIPLFIVAVIGILLLALPRNQWTWRDGAWFAGLLIYYIFLTNAVDRLSGFTFILLFIIPVFALIAREAAREALRNVNASFDVKLVLFLLIWFVATMYASTKGVRFVELMVPAFSIAFGAGVALLSQGLGSWGRKSLHLNAVAGKVITGIVTGVFVLLLIAPTQQAYQGAQHDVPIINDAWYDTLTRIKDSSQPLAIITSWWDFGHHFKYFSDRRVTFDGASQNRPMAHWVGKILMTGDEKQAIGILRMLDCGSNNAFNTLFEKLGDTSDSIDILNKIITMDKSHAQSYLQSISLPADTVAQVLNNTHCNPPEAFFIASGDMIGKSGVWAHFGGWNFIRAEAWVQAKNLPRDQGIALLMKDNLTEEEAAQLYDQVQTITNEQDANTWISPWPSYSADVIGCNRAGQYLTCGNGIEVNLTTMDATLPAQTARTSPAVFAYPTENGIAKKNYNSSSPYSVTLVPQGGNFGVLLAQQELATSMFTRMYYLRGHGLSYFKPFNVQRDSSGLLIYTYKVDWNGTNTSQVSDIVAAMTEPVSTPLPVPIAPASNESVNATP